MVPDCKNYNNTSQKGCGKTKIYNIDLSNGSLKTTTIQKMIDNAVRGEGNISIGILHNNRKLKTPVENIVIPPNNSNTLLTAFLITKELIDKGIYIDDSDGKECIDILLNSLEDEVNFTSYKSKITKCDQYLRVKFSSGRIVYRSEIKSISRINTFLTSDIISTISETNTGCFKPTYRYQAASKGYVDDIVSKSITLNESSGYTAVAGKAPYLYINGGVCAIYGNIQKTVNVCSASGNYLFDIPYSISKSSYSIPIFYNVSGIGDKTSRIGLFSIMNRSNYSECWIHYSSTDGSYSFGVEGSVCTIILDGITFMITNR